MLANQQSFENGFTIWPNPVIDTFQIEWPTNVNSFCLTLYNQLGQLIKKTIPSTNPTLFDISDLSKGVYYLDINSENTKTTKQIVKL